MLAIWLSKASGNFKPFDSLRYLIKTHKLAFEAVMLIWGRKPLAVYGGRMAESVLTILCHILKGEKIIQERLEKEKPAPPVEKKEEGALLLEKQLQLLLHRRLWFYALLVRSKFPRSILNYIK